MSTCFLGEIRAFPYGKGAPRGWAECNGQLLTIQNNTALFSILGTHYGGDGRTTFGLPALNRRVAIGWGQTPGGSYRTLGEPGGTDRVTLRTQEMPRHSHDLQVSTSDATERQPAGQGFAVGRGIAYYAKPEGSGLALDPRMLSSSGQSEAHNNLMPYLTFRFCIALQGDWPPHAQEPEETS
ncbi:phage tail protein [Nocardioides marmoriginsengisoli]|uniref:Phage tail protein n=1 Tax=Nocardioides marmoriginsengisoli TaxID=661483 RepID=A0A3N0CK28_9ACTN|nr:tail fiber protein [Nocardioides marmoriginsengisoli]RNL63293.1 phage tail protein [Nocardioides marmoriginsengisoli]